MSQYKHNSGKDNLLFSKEEIFSRTGLRTGSQLLQLVGESGDRKAIHTKCEMAAPGVLSMGERKRKAC